MPICGRKDVLPPIKDLVTLHEAAVLCRPNKVALIDASTDEVLTFLQLSERSNQFARFLLREIGESLKGSETNNPDGDNIVMICIPPSIDLIVVIFALLKIKCAYLPVDVDFPSSRVDHIINDAKPILLLTKGSPSATSHLKTDGPVKVLELENMYNQTQKENIDTLTEEERARLSSPELVTAILYTSGSTGIPKGVRLPQSATLNRLIWQWRYFPYNDEEIGCFKTALTFVDSISEIFGPLLTGHSVVIIPKVMTTQVETLIEVLEKNKVGRLLLVPSLLRSILLFFSREKEPSLGWLKLWVCSGEVFPTDLLKSFFKIFTKGQSICNFYGSTEILGDVTIVEFINLRDVEEKLLEDKVPIGMPISNTHIYLMNSNSEEEVAEGEVGEIFVAGQNLTNGYVGKAQSEKFIRNPLSSAEYDVLYRTGDFGRYLNGQLHYAGRTDSQMKIRGHRVDLSEVEMALQSTAGVDKCQVLCYKPGEVDQALLGFFSSKTLTKKNLLIELSTKLLTYMIPQLIQIEELPLLVNGKVDRQSLLKLHEEQLLDSRKNIEFDISSCEEDKTDLAKMLLRTVANVLGSSAPSALTLDQNFFGIGGNSLNSILTITSLQDAGYYIGINEFLKAVNFSEVLMKLKKAETGQPLVQDVGRIVTDSENNKFRSLPLTDSMKDEVIRMTAKSFTEKGDFESYLQVTFEEYEHTMQHLWIDLLHQDLSFVVCLEDSEKIIAASLNDDLRRMPTFLFNSKNLRNIFDFLGFCEDAVSGQLPDEVDEVLHSEMMVTSSEVQPGENVLLIKFMEEENIKLAKRKGFKAIFTTNTSELTRHVCEDLFAYKPLTTVQLNQFARVDGSKPFEDAPEALFATTSVYYLTN